MVPVMVVVVDMVSQVTTNQDAHMTSTLTLGPMVASAQAMGAMVVALLNCMLMSA